MYHASQLNQVLLEKNLSTMRVLTKDLQIDHIRSYNSYVSACTPFEQDIAAIFLKYRRAKNIHLTNKYVALLAGCSRRTVTRATNKFHKDGFITKHQPDQYSSNYYTLNESIKKSTFTFMHWLNSLPESHKDVYVSHGIIIDHKNKKVCSDVTPNSSSLLLDSLFSRNVLVSSHAHARGAKRFKKTSDHRKGKRMNSVQKQLILDNRHDPRVKDMLNSPEIMNHVITPIIQKLTTLFTLDEKEQFKLTAFTDETLRYVSIRAQLALERNKTPQISNRMEWLISFALQYCKENELKPDWKWYYDLCDILGITPKTDEKPFPTAKVESCTLKFAGHSKPRKGGIYKPWKAPKEDPVEDQIKNLKRDIEVLSIEVQSNKKASYIIAHAISLIAKKYQQLQMLEGHYDFASVSH